MKRERERQTERERGRETERERECTYHHVPLRPSKLNEACQNHGDETTSHKSMGEVEMTLVHVMARFAETTMAHF